MDKKRTRYIGALCGLGYVEETGAAIMPEHDMEVTFNVEFNKTDVIMVSRNIWILPDEKLNYFNLNMCIYYIITQVVVILTDLNSALCCEKQSELYRDRK